MATYATQFPGNTALQTEVWTLTLAEARAACAVLDMHLGSYWHQTMDRPLRRAKRARAATVRVYTAGFSSGQLSNALLATGATVTRERGTHKDQPWKEGT